MPIFHCPIGAPYYEAENCILCGLCLANSREERIQATEKIRAYLRTRADRRGISKKIAVCGKGGVGKSTTVALLARALLEEEYHVLVFDMDESNPGLFRLFGFDQEPKPLLTLLSRFADDDSQPQAEWLKQEKIFFEDIPAEYTLQMGNLKFIMVGKITDPLQGCACTMADLSRDLMGKLFPKEKEVILVDMEAGIESFGRGVERSVDTVLMVVEPSFESMSLADKIAYMADGIGVNKIRALLNKIPSERAERKILEELEKREIVAVGSVYVDAEVAEASFEGRALGDSEAGRRIKTIARSLMDPSK
jgi:CO dehydrogenase maturation factor